MGVKELPFSDRTDFDDADRGYVDGLRPCMVTGADGSTVWDNDSFGFLAADCPDTANPSLWRQSQLCAKHGLYQVTGGIYQVRGLDLSNMTLVEGDEGVIVIDPLVSVEVAEAALALYRKNRGDRPVTGVIYTHSHIDHFGGVAGVADENTPVIAPEGFMEHAVAENVYAGNAMLRRGMYHTGSALERGPEGLIGTGLGQTASTGTVSLLPPTIDITHTGQEETLDGVRIVFQYTPDTEAPSEMNFYFPDHRALCLAENVTHNLHNILTLRGAVVRDARIWSRYINEAIRLYAERSDVAFASHHWPTWDTERIVALMSGQRDLYGYLHDQTLRYLNEGYTGTEIAELIELPPKLANSWHARGYYGSVSHNVKAIYQRYMGWFDGNPAHLWEHPPTESAGRYVDCMGGSEAVLAKAREYADKGDHRFAVQLLNHLVFAEPDHADGKRALAELYRELGFGAECGTWRNFYLTGAKELSDGIDMTHSTVSSSGMAGALTVEQLFDSIAIRINGPRAWNEALAIEWNLTDLKLHYRTQLSNGVLVHWANGSGDSKAPADLSVNLTKPQLLAMLAGGTTDGIELAGDTTVLSKLLGLIDEQDPGFAIVTP